MGNRTVFDQFFGLTCILGAVFTLAGPVVMSSVLLLCASSVSCTNFDLFLAAAQPFRFVKELFTWLVCVSGMLALALLPFVFLADRAQVRGGGGGRVDVMWV